MSADDIRRLRKKLGYTQAQLAQALNVSQAQISQWETGRAAPSEAQLGRLASVLGGASRTAEPDAKSEAAARWQKAVTSRLSVGWKVVVSGKERLGFGELETYPDESNHVYVAYYQSPVSSETVRVPVTALRRDLLPAQTRCYIPAAEGFRIGRVVQFHEEGPFNTRTYDIRLPNHSLMRGVPETAFHVRSYQSPADPVLTLSSLAQETPFFFERRSNWVQHYADQVALCHGLTGLLSSKIELFPHQIEVVRRVLQDPTIRYLLADEVGLGKTIEAGAILRQLKRDSPDLAIVILAPPLIVTQWRDELRWRFGLADVEVHPHEHLLGGDIERADILVIDEAHRIVATAGADERQRLLFEAACAVTHPRVSRHLLLLSATPALHQEEQLLALLHLLDPEAYDVTAVDAFRARLASRRDIGRALLALGRATHLSILERQLTRTAGLVPNDLVVTTALQAVARSRGTAAYESDLRRAATAIRVHLTETYRVHRRLLRTRRSVLMDQGDLVQQRKESPAEFEISGAHNDGDSNADEITELWRRLDEWRVLAAAYVSACDSSTRECWIRDYVRLATACATDRNRLAELLQDRLRSETPPFEGRHLRGLLELAQRIQSGGGRARLVERLSRRLGKGKWVLFCGSDRACAEVAHHLGGMHRPSAYAIVTASQDEAANASALRRFKNDPVCNWLLADELVEEGLNLQFARGIVLYDLPFSPMRLEQRVGRLDRIDRLQELEIIAVLTLDDPSIAVDAAWYQVLADGLGLFRSSVADLQFLIERELARLSEVAFFGGPAALVSEIERLKAAITTEREIAEEQDILDGLFVGEFRASRAWRDVESAECHEAEFGRSLDEYVEDNLGLKVWFEDETTSSGSASVRAPEARIVTIGQRGDALPLIPVSRLADLAGYVNRRSTVLRTLASRQPELEFLRPGHPLVDALWSLSNWDERGKAFALWRLAHGLAEPLIIFRLLITSSPDLASVQETLDEQGWNSASRASLLRLVASWAPIRRHDVFLGADGHEPSVDISRLCSVRYDNARDINLAGSRGRALVELVGDATWPRLCESMAAAGIEHIRQDRRVIARQAEAQQRAEEYFEMIAARIRSRHEHGQESERLAEDQLRSLRNRASLIREILAAPRSAIDTIGVYVLSELPVCPR